GYVAVDYIPGGGSSRRSEQMMVSRALWAVLVVVSICISQSVVAAPTTQSSVERNGDGLTLHPVSGGVLQLQVWSDRVIRVRFAPGDALPPEHKSLAVTGTPDANAKWEYRDVKDSDVLSTTQLQVKVNRATGAIAFANAAGRNYLAEASR